MISLERGLGSENLSRFRISSRWRALASRKGEEPATSLAAPHLVAVPLLGVRVLRSQFVATPAVGRAIALHRSAAMAALARTPTVRPYNLFQIIEIAHEALSGWLWSGAGWASRGHNVSLADPTAVNSQAVDNFRTALGHVWTKWNFRASAPTA